ncbi:MAG: hypothetical protein J7M30_02440 [Deltaproteobacteria bacterium]|nr:hypothetical protein [Deltaproteobacteria bacterium]
MAIPLKDQKILWAKAAGRCSMPECRKKLVVGASDCLPSKNLLIGENCHIVAESEDGPRGKSILTEEERNRYSNLILMCANHHIVIDNDSCNWPVEKLHQIKSDHELWIETQLTEIYEEDDFELKRYKDLVNFATENLLLSKWDWLSDHAIRLLLYDDFVYGVNDFWFTIQKMVWPKKLPELESSIINLSERLSAYIKHFLSNSRLRDNLKWHVEDKTWTKTWRDDYDEYAKKSDEWQKRSTNFLFNVVVALNEYADCVRKYLNPKYMIYQGKFIINDSLGVLSEMEPSIYIPNKYIEE